MHDKTLEGCTIPLGIKDGLPCMEMRKPAEHDWKKLPQAIMTSDCPWNPTDHDEERDICEFFDDTESATAASIASNDSSCFDPIADDECEKTFHPHELNIHKCMSHSSRKVHFELEDPDADDMPGLIPRTSNANIKFVDEVERDKWFF